MANCKYRFYMLINYIIKSLKKFHQCCMKIFHTFNIIIISVKLGFPMWPYLISVCVNRFKQKIRRGEPGPFIVLGRRESPEKDKKGEKKNRDWGRGRGKMVELCFKSKTNHVM